MQSNNKNAKQTKTCKVARKTASCQYGLDEISWILHTAVNNRYYRSPQNAFSLREKALRKWKRADLTESTDALMPITHTKSFRLWIFTVVWNILTEVRHCIIQSEQSLPMQVTYYSQDLIWSGNSAGSWRCTYHEGYSKYHVRWWTYGNFDVGWSGRVIHSVDPINDPIEIIVRS